MYMGLHEKYVSVILVRFLKKLELYRKIFEKYSNVEFHENPSSGRPMQNGECFRQKL